MPLSTILFHAIVEHDLKPMPRLAHGKRAPRDNVYFANRNALAWILRNKRKEKAIDCVCSIFATVHISNRRKSDIDNFIKSLMDAMVYANVLEDDSLVEYISFRIFRGASRGMVMVAVREGAEAPILTAPSVSSPL